MSFTVVALTLAAKEVPAGPSFPGTLALPPSAAFGETFYRASASLNNFPQAPTFHLQRSSLEESQRSTHTEHDVVSLRRFGRKSPDISFLTALSATNRHRSAASYRFTTPLRSFVRLYSFFLAFPTSRAEGLALGR